MTTYKLFRKRNLIYGIAIFRSSYKKVHKISMIHPNLELIPY